MSGQGKLGTAYAESLGKDVRATLLNDTKAIASEPIVEEVKSAPSMKMPQEPLKNQNSGRKTTDKRKKGRAKSEEKKKIISLHVDKELHDEMIYATAMLNCSQTQYIIEAIEARVRKDAAIIEAQKEARRRAGF